MNFTREPIIETVITPREGCKLTVRSSHANGQEEYLVDAVEVVSFGRSFFFRSLERPKSFLVPVTDYEILELKETRMVLKNTSSERSIKIGGGREAAPFRSSREEGEVAQQPLPPAAGRGPERERGSGNGGKRGQRRRSRRGGGRERREPSSAPSSLGEEGAMEEFPLSVEEIEASAVQDSVPIVPASSGVGEEAKAPSFISKLFPPPPTLIKETLSRYNKPPESSPEETPFVDEDLLDSPLPPVEEEEKGEELEE